MSYTPYPGFITGLRLFVNTATTAKISAGACRDSTNQYLIENNATLTCDATTNGANGLDVGALVLATWYAVFVIDGPTVATASLMSTSPTAPTLPAGYTVFRRIGWGRTAPGSALLRSGENRATGRSREFAYNGPVAVLPSGTANGVWTNINCVHAIPPILCRAQFIASQTTRGGPDLRIRSRGFGNSAFGIVVVSGAAAAPSPIPATMFNLVLGTNSSPVQTLQYQNNGAGGTSTIYVVSYIDEV